ncbi:MAG: hypothetical protein V3U26_02670, partial [Dehalococcoidia bacterium]
MSRFKIAWLLGLVAVGALIFAAACGGEEEAPTPVPSTATPVPPTATPVPATATPTPVAEDDHDD